MAMNLNSSVPFRRRTLFPFRAILTLVFLSFLPGALIRCQSAELSGRPETPARDLTGIWIDTASEGGRIVWIYKNDTGDVRKPFLFTLVKSIKRDLPLSGKRLYQTERSGYIQTRGKEVLLIQEEYHAYISDHSNPEESGIWDPSLYGPFFTERSVRGDRPLVLLHDDGDTVLLNGVSDDDWKLKRVLSGASSELVRKSGIVTECDDQKCLLEYMPGVPVQREARARISGDDGTFEYPLESPVQGQSVILPGSKIESVKRGLPSVATIVQRGARP